MRRGVHRPCGRGTVRHVVPRRWMDAHPCMRWPWWRARAAMDDMGPQRLLHCAARRAAARGERHAGSARPRKLPFRKLPFRKLPSRKLPFRKLLSGNFHSGACDVEIFRQARRARPLSWGRRWRSARGLSGAHPLVPAAGGLRHVARRVGTNHVHSAGTAPPRHSYPCTTGWTVTCAPCCAGPGRAYDSCICMPGFVQHAPGREHASQSRWSDSAVRIGKDRRVLDCVGRNGGECGAGAGSSMATTRTAINRRMGYNSMTAGVWPEQLLARRQRLARRRDGKLGGQHGTRLAASASHRIRYCTPTYDVSRHCTAA